MVYYYIFVNTLSDISPMESNKETDSFGTNTVATHLEIREKSGGGGDFNEKVRENSWKICQLKVREK